MAFLSTIPEGKGEQIASKDGFRCSPHAMANNFHFGARNLGLKPSSVSYFAISGKLISLYNSFLIVNGGNLRMYSFLYYCIINTHKSIVSVDISLAQTHQPVIRLLMWVRTQAHLVVYGHHITWYSGPLKNKAQSSLVVRILTRFIFFFCSKSLPLP